MQSLCAVQQCRSGTRTGVFCACAVRCGMRGDGARATAAAAVPTREGLMGDTQVSAGPWQLPAGLYEAID